MLVDTHCHINFEEFKLDFNNVLARAEANNVNKIICIGTKFSDTPELLKLTAQNSPIFMTVGMHPCNVHEEPVLHANQITAICSNKKIVGLGETGLDYYHSQDYIALQKISFVNHILAAQDSNLPLVIHTRDAEDDTYQILNHHIRQNSFTGVIHCFTGSKEFAYKCLDLGLYISFSGIATFKNARVLQELAASIPLDRILIETDAPYLAPVPNRGQRNEPAFVKHIAEFIANLRKLEFEYFAKEVYNNSLRLFNRL